MSSAVPSAVHRPSVRAGVLAVLLALLLPVLAVSGSSPARASNCPAASTSATYSGGAGTDVSPFRISTTADLMRLSAESGDWDKHFEQTADIDLDGCTWAPIGRDPDPNDANSTVGETPSAI